VLRDLLAGHYSLGTWSYLVGINEVTLSNLVTEQVLLQNLPATDL
jgi:hypothetical protein